MDALTVTPALEWKGHRGFTKRSLPQPIIDEARDSGDRDRVIVRLQFAGVCGSDRSIWFRETFGDLIRSSLKREHLETRIIGHELLGEIVEVGSGAAAQGLKVGQYVSAESHITCGTCYQCLRNEFHVCTKEKILGISTNGCFAEYIKLPTKVLWRSDIRKIRPEIAAIQEPFGNGVHAATKVDLRGKNVAVFGCGPIGLISVLLARVFGAKKIFVIDPLDRQRDLAMQFDADEAFSTSSDIHQGYDPELIALLRDHTNGVGVDVALEMAGYTTSINNAIQSVRRGGDVVLFGLKSGPITIPDFDRMVIRGITLHSVIGRRLFSTWETTRSLLENATNGIQERLWNTLLLKGHETIVSFHNYNRENFERTLLSHPKILISYDRSHA